MSFGAKTGELTSYKHDRHLNFPLYIARNFGLTVIGETASRYFNLVQSSPFGPDKRDFLSATEILRKIDYFKILPGAQAAAATNKVVNGKDNGQTASSNCKGDSCSAANSVDSSADQTAPVTTASTDNDNTATIVDSSADQTAPVTTASTDNDNTATIVDSSADQTAPVTTASTDNGSTATIVDSSAGQTAPVTTASTDNGSTAAGETSEGVFAKLSGSFDNIKGRVSKLGIHSTVTGYVSDNQEWLAIAGSVVAIYSTFNWLTANKIQNGPARNLASMATGVGVTWLGAYALGYQLDFNLVADLGVRIMGYHGLAQALQMPAYWTLGMGARTVSILGKPMAFPAQAAKAK